MNESTTVDTNNESGTNSLLDDLKQFGENNKTALLSGAAVTVLATAGYGIFRHFGAKKAKVEQLRKERMALVESIDTAAKVVKVILDSGLLAGEKKTQYMTDMARWETLRADVLKKIEDGTVSEQMLETIKNLSFVKG